MKKYKFEYISSGWADKSSFAKMVTDVVEASRIEGWEYKDIKVSSDGLDSLLIFVNFETGTLNSKVLV
jgi:hypothetical protein